MPHIMRHSFSDGMSKGLCLAKLLHAGKLATALAHD